MIHCHFCGRILALGYDAQNPSFAFEAVIAQPVADGVIASCDAGCARAKLCTPATAAEAATLKIRAGDPVPIVRTFPTTKRLADFAAAVVPEGIAEAKARLLVARPDAKTMIEALA